jgi:hypothetical protein
MIHTASTPAQQTGVVSNAWKIVAKMIEIKGLHDEGAVRKTSALRR